MLLTGTFSRSIDDKQRIAIPKTLRESFSQDSGGALYVAPGTDGSLSLYPEEAFSRLAQRLSDASPNARQVRDYSRLFFAQACRVELDRQGRVRVPQHLADLVGLGRDAVLIGVQDHLELWDRAGWEAYFNERQHHYDDIAEAAFSEPQSSPSNAPAEEMPPNRTPK